MNYDPDKLPLFVGLSVTPSVDLSSKPTGANAGKFLQELIPQPSPADKRQVGEIMSAPSVAVPEYSAAAGLRAVNPWFVAARSRHSDIHGSVGHHDRECGAASHRWRIIGGRDRRRMGHHKLSSCQRDYSPNFRLALDSTWPSQLFSPCRS